MSGKPTRGASVMEFGFIMLVMVPLLLGTTEIGLNMINTLQTVQLARDAGHMYARGVNFNNSQPGNQQILTTLGAGVGMSATTGAGQGNARVILSQLRYIDNATCVGAGLPVDTAGNPVGCTNVGQWVFAQRINIGNTSMRESNFGTPTGVPFDPKDGVSILLTDQCTNAGDVASFGVTATNPLGNMTGLPSGQVLYVAEAEAYGFRMNPYASNPLTYSYGIF